MIEVEIPEGYEFVKYDKPGVSDYFLEDGFIVPALSKYLHSRIIVKKNKPMPRRVFELTSEVKAVATKGDYFSLSVTSSSIDQWEAYDDSSCKFYIWREIKGGKLCSSLQDPLGQTCCLKDKG